MRRRPEAVDWLLSHPLAAIGLFLVLEAFLPVRFQPTASVCRGLIRAYHHLAAAPLLAADHGRHRSGSINDASIPS